MKGEQERTRKELNITSRAHIFKEVMGGEQLKGKLENLTPRWIGRLENWLAVHMRSL